MANLKKAGNAHGHSNKCCQQTKSALQDNLIEENKSISITTTDTHTKIVLNCLSRADEGVYNLVISNRTGQDTAKFSVRVLDRPAAVEPPMKATLEGNNCTLLWKKVKDDGGVPIEHYQIEKLDSDKDTWCACGHTKENTYTVKGLLDGLQYKFRICAVNRIGDSDFLTSETISTGDATSRGL